MLSTIIVCGLGYAYARRKYQTSPTLQALVQKTKEIYKQHSRPLIEIAEYGDGQGTVRSRVSNFAGWVNWEVGGTNKIVSTSEVKRYPIETCKAMAANLKKHYETEYAQEQAAKTLVGKSVIRPD